MIVIPFFGTSRQPISSYDNVVNYNSDAGMLLSPFRNLSIEFFRNF